MTPAAIRAALGDEVRDCLRVVVTGSREWTAEEPIYQALLEASGLVPHVLRLTVAEGQCYLGGADAIANRWTRMAGAWPWRVPVKRGEHPTARNQRMLDDVAPHLVLAFPLPSSKGTWDCVRRALAMRVPVVVVGVDGSAEVRRG